MKLTLRNNQELVITLKEITDLIGARHNDAMKKVEELAKEDGFGQLREIRISIPKGNGATQEIDTYSFTKKQAIAVGARLNNAMLMKVINRLEELELENDVQRGIILGRVEREILEQFAPKGGLLEENKNGMLRTKPIRGYYRVDKTTEHSMLLQRKYELQKYLNGLMQEDIQLEIDMVDMEMRRLEMQ